jgi:hypothetical protein
MMSSPVILAASQLALLLDLLGQTPGQQRLAGEWLLRRFPKLEILELPVLGARILELRTLELRTLELRTLELTILVAVQRQVPSPGRPYLRRR